MPQTHFLTTLPWNQSIQVYCTGNLTEKIKKQLTSEQSGLLPSTITLFYDQVVSKAIIEEFISKLTQVIKQNYIDLASRINTVFVPSGIDIVEMDSLLKSNLNTLPWAIYYSENGGLNLAVDTDNLANNFGAVPCRAVHNHAVSWETYLTGNKQVWLTTARTGDQDWNWDSDIGHELFHTSFAPIPLFAQSSLKVTANISFNDIDIVEPNMLAKMTYLYGEIAVLTLRGEFRDHPLGLAVVDTHEELIDCLDLTHKLMPHFGFDKAILYCQKYPDRKIDFQDSDIAFLTMAVLRAIKHLNSQLYNTNIPNLEIFRTYS
jgi:hypothetical protein